MEEEIQKEMEKRKEFLEIRKHYIETAHKSSGLFDNTMISLWVWAFWWSMYFINSREWLVSSNILLYARIFLGLSIWLTIISFAISEKANRLSLDKWDEEYTTKDCKKIAILEYKIDRRNRLMDRILKISIVSLLLWVVFLSKFLFINIK